MNKLDRVLVKLGDKTVDLAEAIKSFDYRYLLLAAIFVAGVLVGAILF